MGKNKDISPHKIGQIEVYLSDTTFKQTEIAKKLNVSTQTISAIKKKIKNKEDVSAKRVGNCGRKRVTTPRLDRKI
jgi:DNA-directed RNA polymerase I, II, and III subunit RPABC1